jgi:hypothetical protein
MAAVDQDPDPGAPRPPAPHRPASPATSCCSRGRGPSTVGTRLASPLGDDGPVDATVPLGCTGGSPARAPGRAREHPHRDADEDQVAEDLHGDDEPGSLAGRRAVPCTAGAAADSGWRAGRSDEPAPGDQRLRRPRAHRLLRHRDLRQPGRGRRRAPHQGPHGRSRRGGAPRQWTDSKTQEPRSRTYVDASHLGFLPDGRSNGKATSAPTDAEPDDIDVQPDDIDVQPDEPHDPAEEPF